MPKRKVTTNRYERKAKRTRTTQTKPETAFPVSEQTPGQSRSREAFSAFEKQHESCGWWADYAHLRNEGVTWRVAAYIAWASSPLQRRWPATLKELATTVLGLRSDTVIYKWRKMDPTIDARVEAFRAEPLLRYRQDVLAALIDVASTHDPGAHNDRKLFLEMSGDYKPRQAMELSGANGGPVHTLAVADLAGLSDAELEQFIANLQAIERAAGRGAAGADVSPADGEGNLTPNPSPKRRGEPDAAGGVDGAAAGDVGAGAAV